MRQRKLHATYAVAALELQSLNHMRNTIPKFQHGLPICLVCGDGKLLRAVTTRGKPIRAVTPLHFQSSSPSLIHHETV